MTASHPASALERPRLQALEIRVSRGTGSGRTRLSAFDAALRDAGVANFNLVRLSSVVPPGSHVREVGREHQLQGGHGDVLFCVYADAYASIPGTSAWAGVAWSEHHDGSRSGLFVEHGSHDEHVLRHHLESSLADLSEGRGGDFRPAGQVVASRRCVDEDRPVCAVVVASYATRSWDWAHV
ncbi:MULTISPECIES: pyruvoyl-dependent arginine decarboxylase [Desertihabitans]|uniref:Pyruvoyl-dependent arginine decarboxylase AaxB n=1 Tax=Desertihabitans brevis TaxID=2268447 RepID=A0A367YUP2_9ACTN|nr:MULTISPECIES: pyruvoyl-dependent arginine decarboxylase [Desertihabitans]RCK68742.1 pyruvoyl-dependent arginine decarboxylase [Desertihabitans brevis]